MWLPRASIHFNIVEHYIKIEGQMKLKKKAYENNKLLKNSI